MQLSRKHGPQALQFLANVRDVPPPLGISLSLSFSRFTFRFRMRMIFYSAHTSALDPPGFLAGFCTRSATDRQTIQTNQTDDHPNSAHVKHMTHTTHGRTGRRREEKRKRINK